ncbi:MAG: aspartate aminotransferase [Gammaproteobacteria bacterium]|nr:MAG: aspartate aminotransferase [Gammaproteobacteria bacterium]
MKNTPPKSTKHEYVYHWVLAKIKEQHYLPNQKLPSVRQLATRLRVSHTTIATAYDNLVADGHIRATKGIGYYVEKSHGLAIDTHAEKNAIRTSDLTNSAWLMSHLFNHHPESHYPGRGRLPAKWLPTQHFHAEIKKSLANTNGLFTSYGSIHGLKALRELFARNLTRIGVTADLDNMMTTAGVCGAIDLLTDYFLEPHDVVLVDAPCWFWLIGCLKMKNIQIIGIDRTATGPNLEQIQSAASKYRPKLYITNAVLHNPTSFNVNPASIHAVLNLAEQYGFYILEDDIYSELAGTQESIRYASLDNNERVFYCSSPSKVIGGNFKVGVVCSPQQHTDGLLKQKMLSQMCVAELNERLILAICASPHYRKHLERLTERLSLAHENLAKQLRQIGLVYPEHTMSGLFVWQQLPCNTDTLAVDAKKAGWLIAPGSLFSPNGQHTNYTRLNVALTSAAFLSWLARYLDKKAK